MTFMDKMQQKRKSKLKTAIKWRKHIFCACVVVSVSLTPFRGLAREAQTLVQTSDTLSLSDFLDKVVRLHPALRAASLETQAARAEITQALGGFDPLLKSTYEFKTKDEKEKINFFDSELEVPLNTLFGPKIKAGFRRGIGSSINSDDLTSSGGEASLGVSVPLFQGIFTDRRRASLQRAELRPDVAQATISQERNNLLRAAGTRYWDWSEAVAQLSVVQNLLTIAEQRSNQITIRARAGEVAPIDTVEAQSEVLRRRAEVERAKRTAEQTAIEIAQYIWNSDINLDPVREAPERIPLPSLPTNEQVARDRQNAVLSRPEVRRIELQQKFAEIDVQLAEENMRPNIEANASAMFYTLGNSPLENYKLGFTVSQPLLFRGASGQKQLSQITADRVFLQKLQAQRSVAADVENSLSALERAQARIQLAEEEVKLLEILESAERTRFSAGESTLLIVNIRERATAEARGRLVAAKADFQRALILYRWATATL